MTPINMKKQAVQEMVTDNIPTRTSSHRRTMITEVPNRVSLGRSRLLLPLLPAKTARGTSCRLINLMHFLTAATVAFAQKILMMSLMRRSRL